MWLTGLSVPTNLLCRQKLEIPEVVYSLPGDGGGLGWGRGVERENRHQLVPLEDS